VDRLWLSKFHQDLSASKTFSEVHRQCKAVLATAMAVRYLGTALMVHRVGEGRYNVGEGRYAN
jgi:hypothetical protein